MKLNVLSALLMSASLSAFVISCDEYGKKQDTTASEPGTVDRYGRPVTPSEQRAEAKEEANEERQEVREESADVKMDLTNRISELEKEWNELGAKMETRPELKSEYQTLSRDIEQQLQNAKAQVEQIDQGTSVNPEQTREQLDQRLDELEKRIDQAEERLG